MRPFPLFEKKRRGQGRATRPLPDGMGAGVAGEGRAPPYAVFFDL